MYVRITYVHTYIHTYLGLSSDVLLHPCLHHIIVINSEAAACMMSQHVCTADHNIPSLHYLALPCPSCISYSLHTQNLLLYILTCVHPSIHPSIHPCMALHPSLSKSCRIQVYISYSLCTVGPSSLAYKIGNKVGFSMQAGLQVQQCCRQPTLHELSNAATHT
jgi:hypothetical protein